MPRCSPSTARFTSFAQGGLNWRLVGDTFTPLSPSGPMLSIVRPLPQVQSITDAQAVVDGSKAWSNSGYAPTVNFLNTGAFPAANFGGDSPGPRLDDGPAVQ